MQKWPVLLIVSQGTGKQGKQTVKITLAGEQAGFFVFFPAFVFPLKRWLYVGNNQVHGWSY